MIQLQELANPDPVLATAVSPFLVRLAVQSARLECELRTEDKCAPDNCAASGVCFRFYMIRRLSKQVRDRSASTVAKTLMWSTSQTYLAMFTYAKTVIDPS